MHACCLCVAPFVLSGVARRRTARDAARQPKRDIMVIPYIYILYSQRHNIVIYRSEPWTDIAHIQMYWEAYKESDIFFTLFYLWKKETTKKYITKLLLICSLDDKLNSECIKRSYDVSNALIQSHLIIFHLNLSTYILCGRFHIVWIWLRGSSATTYH